MSEYKNVLNINDNWFNFCKIKNNFLYCVGFTDEELELFEIHLETPPIFRGNFDFGQIY